MNATGDLVVPVSSLRDRRHRSEIHVLLVGPYDPKGGEYTFLAPPLGVWRLAGTLEGAGIIASVFDPNCCVGEPEERLAATLKNGAWDAVGFSTTGMTLPYDLALAHLTRRLLPRVRLIAGGMEATFNVDTVMSLAPFDLAVLGEGEEPLLEIASRLSERASLEGVPGTAWRDSDGTIRRAHRPALTRDGLKQSIFQIPYERMPYQKYWDRLERCHRVGELPVKAEREARLAEIRSVRLITLNYCPMGCTFCSSTNFQSAAQGGTTAKVSRLDETECVAMIERIVGAHPTVRTIIFQDDIFVFRNDKRILPLCAAIVAAKEDGTIPAGLQFISTNRIDAMTTECLTAMRHAGFRVLGFGVESFSLEILREFNKAQIYPFIAPMLDHALRIGVTPFLDMILTSPRCHLGDLAENIRQAFKWVVAGCEVGMYPYVIPFSGAAMARDAALRPATVFERRTIAGTGRFWNQPAKILPLDTDVRDAILEIESQFESTLAAIGEIVPHLPSRVRSLVWILSAIPALERRGCDVPRPDCVAEELVRRLPGAAASTSIVRVMAKRRRAG